LSRSPSDDGRSADPRGRSPGSREVLLVGLLVVAVVLGAALLTDLLPAGLRSVVLDTPLAIVVLVLGTALVLWRAATRRS
jgi:hypothetical protein